jgi:hypothetical protein
MGKKMRYALYLFDHGDDLNNKDIPKRTCLKYSEYTPLLNEKIKFFNLKKKR